jgi:PD-(D/E)XK nuclease superfamily
MSSKFSNSFLQSYQKCPLQCFYRYEQHLQRADDDLGEHHLVFGRAMHEAFKVLYTTGNVKEAVEALSLHYPTQLDPDDLAKTAANGAYAIKTYWEHYNGDPDWEIVSCEEIDSAEDGYVVKPDLVVRDKYSNLFLVDHKFTKSYLNYKFFDQFSPNSQITQYIRWAKEKFGAADGFLVNAVNFLFLKRKSAQRPAGFTCEFERQVFNVTKQQIAQDELAKAYWIERIQESREKNLWPMNTTSCTFCTYRSICSSGWDWENDSSLVLNTFRQVCEKWDADGQFHCALDLGHEGNHSPLYTRETQEEFQVEV